MTDNKSPPEHTPGPWQRNAPPASKYVTVFAGRNIHIAAIKPEGKTQQECEANINLIAAAPDLLDACQEFVRKVDEGEARSVRSYAQMKAAIAKATGAA
jgi:hypothetical protein